MELFKQGYVNFYATMKAFDRNKELEKKRKEKKIVTTASTETESNTKEVQKEQHPENLKVCLSSDDSDCESDDDSGDFNSESALAQKDKEDGRIEAEVVAKNWRKFVTKEVDSNWFRDIFREVDSVILPKDGTLDIVDDLLKLDFEPIYKVVVTIGVQRKLCLLPLMMCCSKYQLGALNSQSFAERINSAANRVVTEDTIRINSTLVDMLVTLRMNKRFMDFIKDSKYQGNIQLLPKMEDLDGDNDGTDELWSTYTSSNV